ncbi:unnamed protein product [Discosporangium mesarthrocarpum]
MGADSKASFRSPICVECGRPVELLFRQYTKGSIRLGRCSACSAVADKYIEYEFVLVAIDLTLHRIQAYRHVLFNREHFSTNTFQGRLWQLGIGMAALDAYLRQVVSGCPRSELSQGQCLAEGYHISAAERGTGATASAVQPLVHAGVAFLVALFEHILFVGGVFFTHWGARWFRSSRVRPKGTNTEESHPEGTKEALVAAHGPSRTKVYMAVVYPLLFRLVASFVIIWDQQAIILNIIGLLVLTMQYVALTAVLEGVPGGGGGGSWAAAAVTAGMVGKVVARIVVFLVTAGKDHQAFCVL